MDEQNATMRRLCDQMGKKLCGSAVWWYNYLIVRFAFVTGEINYHRLGSVFSKEGLGKKDRILLDECFTYDNGLGISEMGPCIR